MTVVIGIVCTDGIVIACDSQVEFNRGSPVKRLNANKIYQLDGNIAIAGAGMIAFIEKAVDNIKIAHKELKDKGKLSVKNLVEGVDDVGGCELIMSSIHKAYDIDRVKYLYGSSADEEIVDVFLMIGGIEQTEQGEYESRLYLLHKIGFAEPVNDYATIGSGAAYAEYLLSRYYEPSMEIKEGKRLGIYTIKEVEKMDPNVGGPINVVTVGESGCQEVDEKDALQIYAEMEEKEELINELMRGCISGRVEIEDLRKLERP